MEMFNYEISFRIQGRSMSRGRTVLLRNSATEEATFRFYIRNRGFVFRQGARLKMRGPFADEKSNSSISGFVITTRM